jgi:hypothetical protein
MSQFEKLKAANMFADHKKVSDKDKQALEKLSDTEVQLLMLLRVRLQGEGAENPTLDDSGGCF